MKKCVYCTMAKLSSKRRKNYLFTKKKSLVGLPGVNFTNVLQAAFTRADPKSAKKTVKLSCFFALLGSARVKAARRMLVKLSLVS